jgi:transposase-like protein
MAWSRCGAFCFNITMNTLALPHPGYRFPAEVISHCVWLYFRFLLVQSRRSKRGAARFFRKLLRGLKYAPRVEMTDDLASYNAPCTERLPNTTHRHDKGLKIHAVQQWL